MQGLFATAAGDDVDRYNERVDIGRLQSLLHPWPRAAVANFGPYTRSRAQPWPKSPKQQRTPVQGSLGMLGATGRGDGKRSAGAGRRG